MSHNSSLKSEISSAVDKISQVNTVTLGSSDVLNLYFSLLQNSVYQAMLNSFLADKGILKTEELVRLDKKNDDYNEAVDKFLSNVAKNLPSVGENKEHE